MATVVRNVHVFGDLITIGENGESLHTDPKRPNMADVFTSSYTAIPLEGQHSCHHAQSKSVRGKKRVVFQAVVASDRQTPDNAKQGLNRGRVKLTTKIILLGDPGVGKSSVLDKVEILRLQDVSLHSNTSEDSSGSYNRQKYRRRSSVGGSSPKTVVETVIRRDRGDVSMAVYDTAGQERYRSLTSSYYRGAHGCIVMFDVTSASTFESVPSWLTDLNTYSVKPEMVSTIMVGCHYRKSKPREVSQEKAEQFAAHIGVPYMEICLEQVDLVAMVFERLADMILDSFTHHSPVLGAMETPQDTPSTRVRIDTMEKKDHNWCSC